MRKILLCFLLALTMVLSAVPMLAMTASADEGAPAGDGGASATVLTPEDIYVPGATVFLSAFGGENNIVVNGDGTASWTDAKTGSSYPLIGNSANIVGTYSYDHVSGFNAASLTVANHAQKVHYAEDGMTELYRATLTIYTDPALPVAAYGGFKIVADNGTEVVACRSALVIEAKDESGNWSSDPALASYKMGGWELDPLGGIGYTLPDFFYSALSNNPLKDHYVELGAEALPESSMTFEIVTSINGATDVDGFRTTLSKNTAYEGDGDWRLGFRIGALNIVPRVTSPSSPGCAPGIGKVIVAYAKDHSWSPSGRIVDSVTSMSGITQGSTIAVTKKQVGSQFSCTVSMQGTEIASMTTGDKYQYISNDELIGAPFRVAQSLPEKIYAIRVYATALTNEQLAQNHFADLAKYYGLDLTSFSAMNEAYRQTIYDTFSTLDFSQSTEEVQALLEDNIATITYEPEMNQYDALYVQKGLTILLTAYDGNEKVINLINGNGTWQNKIADKNGVYKKFSIIGQTKEFAFTDASGVIHEGDTAWKKLAGGGIGYEATLAQLQSGLNNYVDIGVENLPANHTVEMIFDPYGAYLDGTEYYRDGGKGNAERWNYIVTAGNIGVYSKHEIPANSGKDIAPLDSFYISYQLDGIWTGPGYQNPGVVSSMSLNTADVVNLTVVREELAGKVKTGIKVYDGPRSVANLIGNYDVLASRGSQFYLLRETPGALYAVRVYDRVLTEEERAQNHFADICNYYKLDLEDFYNTAILPESLRQEVYTAMLSVDFSLTREKAQDILTSSVFSSLLTFDGFTLQTEGSSEELSAIFTVSNSRIEALIELGYTVTYGGILADATVSFDEMLYDGTTDGTFVFYLFSNDSGITTTPVFVTETDAKNQFGLSVYYDTYTTPENYGKLYRFRGFAVLEKDGQKLIAYVDAKTDSLGDAVSHYSAAEHLTMLDDYQENTKLIASMDRSFNNYNVYVDIENGSDENDGNKNAPVKSLEKAIELAIELINSMTMPNVNIVLSGGKYELEETLTVDADLVTADFYRLNFKNGEAEAPIITGTFDISGDEFLLYDESKNIYVYYLPESEKGADGKYPAYQNFYVEGKMATLARSHWFDMALDEYKTADGYFVIWVPEELLAGTVGKGENGKYYLVGDHIETMRWAVRMNFYYYDLVLEGVDLDVTNSVSQIPNLAVINSSVVIPTNPSMRSTEGYVALKFYSDHGSLFNRSHQNLGTLSGHNYPARLSGCMSFLDEEGEYYYDQAEGAFYYIPAEGENVYDMTFSISTLETLLYLDGMSNVSFEGITFTGTDSVYVPTYGFTGGQAGSQKRMVGGSAFIHEGAIIGQNVTNITVKNCTFTELYYQAISFTGIVNKITIDSNVFTYLGASAIQLGKGGYSPSDNNSNVRITNNYLQEIAFIFYNNCAVNVTNVRNAKILQNSIIDCAYTGISVGWSWTQTSAPVGTYFNVFNCEIAYNYIENFMFMMFDGGSIYTLGGNAPKEYGEYLNELHHNYSYCGSRSGHYVADGYYTSTALYHDGGSSHWFTHDNVTWVDQETLGQYNYISIQAGEAGSDATQAYNIYCESNYFINLYQKYLTLGYRRVREDWNVIESNSYLLTTLSPEEFDDTYISVYVTHTVSKNPANWAPFYQSGRVEAMDEIMAFAGCNLFDGIYKGAPLGDLAYDYNYRLLTQSETWYTPERDNPDYPDR